MRGWRSCSCRSGWVVKVAAKSALFRMKQGLWKYSSDSKNRALASMILMFGRWKSEKIRIVTSEHIPW